MFGMYTKKEVERLVQRLREEYSAVLKEQQSAAQAIKEENRVLAARLAQLEGERASVARALVGAEEAGRRAREEEERAAQNGGKELSLLLEKCRLLLHDLQKKYPDADDVKEFAAFTQTLRAAAGEEEEEDGLNMEEVLAPKQPLDLGKLCKDLGLMEDGE